MITSQSCPCRVQILEIERITIVAQDSILIPDTLHLHRVGVVLVVEHEQICVKVLPLHQLGHLVLTT